MSDHSAESQRLFAYCHDGVGIGHLSRTAAICTKLREVAPDLSFLIATGTPYVSLFEGLNRADYIKLPALEKIGAQDYRSKFFPSLPAQGVLRCRANMIRSSVEYFRPDVVLVDKAPLGVSGELLPTLTQLRTENPKTRIVFGMRDVEDAPETTIAEWTRAGITDRLDQLFDEIWVYGARELFDVAAKYRLPSCLNRKLRYMGYIAPSVAPAATEHDSTDPFVLVTVGGGTDGEFLLSTYLEEAAGRLGRMGIRSVMVAGPDLPAGPAARLSEAARSIQCVEWVEFESRMGERLRSARLVVSMGGYNTLCQIAAYRKRAIVVPRVSPRREQLIRAKIWSDLGVVQMLLPENVHPKALADRVEAGLTDPFECRADALDLGGLSQVAKRFGELVAVETKSAPAVRV